MTADKSEKNMNVYQQRRRETKQGCSKKKRIFIEEKIKAIEDNKKICNLYQKAKKHKKKIQ